jgi:serine/threonine-protein kinase
VLDFGEHAGRPYFVTEPLPERTLGDCLRDEAPLEPARVLSMLAPVASALDAAHMFGLVHQALGTDTLLLARDGRVLLDWFALFETGEETEWWGVGGWGDLRYRPPEQLRGVPLEPSGNVYSLAAVVVHALTGEPPYTGEPSTLVSAHLSAPPPKVSARVPALGQAADDVVAGALAKSGSQRPLSATVLLEQLADALGTEPPARGEPLVAGKTLRPMPPPRRRPAPFATAIAITVAALCGCAIALAVEPFGDQAPRTDPRPAAAAAWKRLDSQQVDLRAQLAVAGTPQEQAEIAGRLASAYDEAARAAGPGAQASEARAVRDAYARLAAAAEAGQKDGYAQASQAIADAEQRLQARR